MQLFSGTSEETGQECDLRKKERVIRPHLLGALPWGYFPDCSAGSWIPGRGGLGGRIGSWGGGSYTEGATEVCIRAS